MWWRIIKCLSMFCTQFAYIYLICRLDLGASHYSFIQKVMKYSLWTYYLLNSPIGGSTQKCLTIYKYIHMMYASLAGLTKVPHIHVSYRKPHNWTYFYIYIYVFIYLCIHMYLYKYIFVMAQLTYMLLLNTHLKHC